MHLLATFAVEEGLQGAQGLTITQLTRGVAVAGVVVAVVLLVWVEFVSRRRLQSETYHWLLLLGLLVLPAAVLFGATASLFEETKTVGSCASCHVMEPFVSDLRDPQSETLAARHFRNKWISDQQCYTCHATYGVHGTLSAKKDGLRHWLLYTTGTWKEPIEFRGTYPNANCLACHAGTPKYESDIHKEIAGTLARNEMGCIDCHGPPHPPAGERAPARTP